ncbi:hypothetical protein [Salinispora arenicola]|uniref:hypothetical protein n=1 Tax=Salinispora arenicola TaxID=168697 RepID=UPI0012BC6C22|nr:hypothetical protein [Salinispora arenicola]
MRNQNEFSELRQSFAYRLHIWAIRIFAGSFAAGLLLVLAVSLGLLPDQAAALVVVVIVTGASAVFLMLVTMGRVSRALKERGAMRSIDAQIPYFRKLISDLFNLK